MRYVALTFEEADYFRNHNKLAAIRSVRERTGMGLEEAKRYVEAWDGMTYLDPKTQNDESQHKRDVAQIGGYFTRALDIVRDIYENGRECGDGFMAGCSSDHRCWEITRWCEAKSILEGLGII